MISTFLGARQDPTPSPRQSVCNYLHFEIEHLEERDLLTFRNETVKLLSEIQYKAKGRKRQVTKNQEVTTYQLPEASQATAGCEYILTIPETQAVSQCASVSADEHTTVIFTLSTSTSTVTSAMFHYHEQSRPPSHSSQQTQPRSAD